MKEAWVADHKAKKDLTKKGRDGRGRSESEWSLPQNREEESSLLAQQQVPAAAKVSAAGLSGGRCGLVLALFQN